MLKPIRLSSKFLRKKSTNQPKILKLKGKRSKQLKKMKHKNNNQELKSLPPLNLLIIPRKRSNNPNNKHKLLPQLKKIYLQITKARKQLKQ